MILSRSHFNLLLCAHTDLLGSSLTWFEAPKKRLVHLYLFSEVEKYNVYVI